MRIPRITGRKLIQLLCSKAGFWIERQRGSHVLLKKEEAGNTTVLPVPVHANRELAVGLLSNILREAGITREEFFQWFEKR